MAAAASAWAIADGASSSGTADQRSARSPASALAQGRHARSGGASRRGAPSTRHATASSQPRLPADVAVGLRVLRFVDRARRVRFNNGLIGPRTLVTEVRYPAVGRRGGEDVRNAAPLRAAGPYPLVIFGHGFAVTPDVYASLLDAWARAGYVVAAPVFQLGSPDAPGGPNEADLPNWPRDMRYVLSGMLDAGASSHRPFAGLIERNRVAVAGQSDGGDTALAIAYDPALRDRRVDAAVILSGAEIPQLGPFAFPAHGPPLLAAQGTEDTINPPSATTTFFSAASPPKYLLQLLGATHLPPYTTAQPYLGVVERVTIAFLDYRLKDQRSALGTMLAAGKVNGVAAIEARG